jgi:hypothetical protein
VDALPLAQSFFDHTIWPLAVIAACMDSIFGVLIVRKLIAYLVSWSDTLGPNGERLRYDRMEWYHHGKTSPWSYVDELRAGRSRTYTTTSDIGFPNSVLDKLHGYAFKAPTVVLMAAIASVSIAPFVPKHLAFAMASAIAALVLAVVATSLLNRLVMGPFDQFNPDLRPGKATEKRLHDPSSSSLIPYVLVMLVLNIVGFTAVYANTGHALPSAFTGNESGDILQWFYFSLTLGQAPGIDPASDIGLLFVVLQVICDLAIGTVTMFFFSQRLPTPDPNWQRPESRFRSRANRSVRRRSRRRRRGDGR